MNSMQVLWVLISVVICIVLYRRTVKENEPFSTEIPFSEDLDIEDAIHKFSIGRI